MENKNVEEIWGEIEAKLLEKSTPYEKVNAVFQFELTDAEDGIYQLELSDGSAAVYYDANKKADCTLKMKERYFRKFLQGDLNSTAAFMSGKLKVNGNIGLALKLESMLTQYDFAK